MFIAFLAASVTMAQALPEKINLKFSDPSKPGLLKASVMNGNLTIEGVSGTDVMVECRFEKDSKKGEVKKVKGMYRIQPGGSGLVVEEENNVVTIKTEAWSDPVHILVKVPIRTSLKVRATMGGTIKVTNLNGEHTVSHVNGKIVMEKISGSVIANTTNGSLKVSFEKYDTNKPMSFISFNGDVDITFPGQLKADVRLKTTMGEILSDYPITLLPVKTKVPREEGKSGKRFVIKRNGEMKGTINGGGQELIFKTFNGDIVIRQKK